VESISPKAITQLEFSFRKPHLWPESHL